MVSNRDLMLGVERGIISQDQLAQLVAIAAESKSDEAVAQLASDSRSAEDAQDEAPRFIRSFGDLFIAIGTGFLGAGLRAAVAFLGDTAVAQLGALILIWLAAEWLTGYLRISAPSIVLSILFTGFAASYLPGFFNTPIYNDYNTSGEFKGLMIIGVSGLLAAGLFFLRFRLPFALAIVGFCAVGLMLTFIGSISPEFLWSNFRWIIGLGGAFLFSVAMWFDGHDPLRKSLRSDCGFWLHLIAAPMLTHAVLWDSHPAITNLQKMLGAPATIDSWLIISGFFILFGLIALLINRRALLVSSIGYVGSVIAYGVWNLELPAGATTTVILLIIATLILTFGVGWKPLRRVVLRIVPQGRFLDRLPPAHA